MRTIRITLAQINTTVGDFDGNVNRMLAALREAENAGSDLAVFPELAIAGYPPEDLLLKSGFLHACTEAFDRFRSSVGNTPVVVGYVRGEGPVANAAALIRNGETLCTYDKAFLPNYGVFDEKRYFTAGNAVSSFRIGDVHLGLSICEDTWVDNGPHKTLSLYHQVDCILNLSASPFHAGKIRERRELLATRARESNAAFVYVNLVGGQDELVFDGGSLVYSRTGECLLVAPSFLEAVCHIDLSFEGLGNRNTICPTVIDRSNDPREPLTPMISPDLSVPEEVLEALVLGTGDYIRKNRFSKVVIGLSGGIDSALVAAVAVSALGPENVVGVTMPSKYTSEGTRSDAEILARNLGIEFHEIPIGPAFGAFTDSLSPLFEGRAADVAEENIQARVRGTLLMALSNKFGWLVLTTGNKSEMATGYATLYGDMAGGFAVIKDVPKTMVYKVSRLINEQAGREVIPESIIDRPPTAELRPNQKDSDSLPPYDILDGILKAYIEDDEGVDTIAAMGYDRETVRRVAGLVDRSEYKRRQAPPGVKITPRAFGRDRRLPITNRFRP
jgi:NAD+ synthase (glutamine-hydrolysing)